MTLNDARRTTKNGLSLTVVQPLKADLTVSDFLISGAASDETSLKS